MPFLSGRAQASRGYFGGGTTPDAPTLGTLTTSISSPNTVSTPSMTQDENNASFSWSSPGASGVTIGVPFTAPTFNGGLTITDYEYSTDDGSTWKSSGSTSSPISITTVSSSSANLSAATSYTVRLRAVNPLGSGTPSANDSKTTPTAVTSYTIRVYNNRGSESITETITGNTSGTYSRSHYQTAADWSVTVAAVNSNGTGSYSSESSQATGWALSSCTNYNSSGCDDCGSKATTCSQWTRSGSTSGPCNISCGTEQSCSPGRTYYSTTGTYDGIHYTEFTDWLGYSSYLRRTADGSGGCGCDSYYAWSVSYCSLNGWRHTPIGCAQWVISCG